jgi:Protein of unknown function (DUF2695)
VSKNPRKEALKRAFKQREREKLIASIPISHEDLRDLFNHLDRGGIECDHTLRETIAFLEARHLDVERVTAWLREYGGFCDCEVIYNVDEKFGEIVGR